MRNVKYFWIMILLLVFAVLIIPPVFLLSDEDTNQDDPWAHVPQKLPHVDHSNLMEGPFEDGQSVTRACLECHNNAAQQVMTTAHWTWETPEAILPGRDKPVKLGKKFAINNFCIGIRSNWPACTICHAGYGWQDENYDFSNSENVDCLVCHDHSGNYVKTISGYPSDGVDLLTSAKSVGNPTRENCGSCHFNGGGGNAVKHGDLDGSLSNPKARVDVHMGKHGFVCIDCHQTTDHQIKGRAISVSFDNENQVRCSDCHSKDLHRDDRITAHISDVSCQTCHIAIAAVKQKTKTYWDWSSAGQDLPEDHHSYLKIKGRFEFQKQIIPEYNWYSGIADHYLFGDKMDPQNTTSINYPKGDIENPNAKIWPFKVHRGKQIYDKEYNYFLQPKNYGEGGFWEDFDFDKAVRLGSEVIGLPYSGSYGFAETEMFWPLTHMVAPKKYALRCINCHGDSPTVRMRWEELGYDGDPIFYGGRDINNYISDDDYDQGGK